MSKRDSGFDYDRYRKLLAEAVDEPKRLALIELLLSEKARDQLAAANTRGLIGSIILGNRSHPPDDAEEAGEAGEGPGS